MLDWIRKLPDYRSAHVPKNPNMEPFCEAWCGRTEPKYEGGICLDDREWLFHCSWTDTALADLHFPP